MVGRRKGTTKAGKEHRVALEVAGEGGAWVILKVPFDVEGEFGSRGRVAVQGTINGHPFRTSIFPAGDGTHFMMVNKAMQKQAGVGTGDRVRLTLVPDAAPRAVDVPADLARALSGRRVAKERFAALPPSHKREYVRHVDEAKKPETRARRIARAIAALES